MTPTVPTLYRQMALSSLLNLQEAYRADRYHAVDPVSLAFFDQRLALIARELKMRASGDAALIEEALA